MAIAEEQQLNRGQGSLSWELDSKTWVDIHIHMDTLQGQQEALHELKVFVQSDLRKKIQIKLEYSADVNNIKKNHY